MKEEMTKPVVGDGEEMTKPVVGDSEEMTKPVVGDSSEIVVAGKDMFGAAFSEKTKLISLSKEEFSFSLYRPVSEDAPLQVNFHPEATENFWVKGKIVKVKSRLDGMQTVGVKVLEYNVH